MKPPETNHGAHVDTEGHSVFHILPADSVFEPEPEPPVDRVDAVLAVLQWVCALVGGVVFFAMLAGFGYQLFQRFV